MNTVVIDYVAMYGKAMTLEELKNIQEHSDNVEKFLNDSSIIETIEWKTQMRKYGFYEI